MNCAVKGIESQAWKIESHGLEKTKQVNSACRAIWLVPLYLGMAISGEKKWHANPILSENKITISELLSTCMGHRKLVLYILKQNWYLPLSAWTSRIYRRLLLAFPDAEACTSLWRARARPECADRGWSSSSTEMPPLRRAARVGGVGIAHGRLWSLGRGGLQCSRMSCGRGPVNGRLRACNRCRRGSGCFTSYKVVEILAETVQVFPCQ